MDSAEIATASAEASARDAVLILQTHSDARVLVEHVVHRIDASVDVENVSNPADALAWASRRAAVLVVVDYALPESEGLEFIRRLRALPGYRTVPILVLIGNVDREVRYRALDAGANDFLVKPLDVRECMTRCRNLITLRQQELALDDRRRLLEGMVDEATREVREREKETLLRLARVGEYRDTVAANHLVRIARYSRLIADTIGLAPDEAEGIELGAPLHDIGKIGIPDQILLKPGKLDETEWRIMRTHPVIGYELLRGSASVYVRTGALIALGHHERYDGSGYPNGAAGDEIALAARVVAVADVYDALTSVRPHKPAWSYEEVFEYMRYQSGKHFDPELLDAFLAKRGEVLRIQQEFGEPADGGMQSGNMAYRLLNAAAGRVRHPA